MSTAPTPVRVQLSRAKGWRMPPNTVVVARPSRWGNPYRVGDSIPQTDKHGITWMMPIKDAAEAVALYEAWMRLNIERDPKILSVDLVQDFAGPPFHASLRGKNLACWCKLGTPCHADVLLRLANKATP